MMNQPPPPPTSTSSSSSRSRQRFEKSMQVTSRRREDLQKLKARLSQRMDPTAATATATSRGMYTHAHAQPMSMMPSNGPAPVQNVAPYRPQMSVHRNLVLSGLGNGGPPPAPPAPSLHSAVNQFRSAVPLSSTGVLSDSKGTAGSTSSNIPRFGDTRASVNLNPTPVNHIHIAPPTPQTIRRAEEALGSEKPVDSKKGMIYLMNTYNGTADGASAVGRDIGGKRQMRTGSDLVQDSTKTMLPAVLATGEPQIPSFSQRTNFKGELTHQKSIHMNGAANAVTGIDSKQIMTINMDEAISPVGASETNTQLKLLKMVQKEQLLKEKALKQSISANSRKNYRMFALLLTKVIKRKYEVAEMKSFVKLREYKFIHAHSAMASNQYLPKVPKFESNIYEHTTKLAYYTVRTIETKKKYDFEVPDSEYRSKFDTSDNNSISVHATINADNSLAVLSQGQFYHRINGEKWSQNIRGKISFIDNFGSEEEYDLNHLFSEMLAVRDAYIKSVNKKDTRIEMSLDKDPSVVIDSKLSDNKEDPYRYRRNDLKFGGNSFQNIPSSQSNINLQPETALNISDAFPRLDSTTSTMKPEEVQVESIDMSFPPTITRISTDQIDKDAVKSNAQLNKQNSQKKNVELPIDNGTPQRYEVPLDLNSPMLLKQPKIVVDYLPITPPTNPIVYALFLPSRIIYYFVKMAIINFAYLVVVLSLWFYVMDDMAAEVRIPSGVIGVGNVQNFVYAQFDLLPNEVKHMVGHAMEFVQDMIS